MPILICTHGNNIDDIFAVKDGTNRIGRSPACTIKIYDKSCSRDHAEIYKKGDMLFIQDLGSRHGTDVNGKPVSRREKLRVGDVIRIGHTQLRVSEGEPGSFEAPDREVEEQVNTQEISDRLLAAEVDLVRKRRQKPQSGGGGLFKRMFGGG